MRVGTDYLVDAENPSSRTFTVSFQPKQQNSTDHVILLADNLIFEGTKYFQLRIVAARPTGQAAVFFRAVDRLNETTVEIAIADNDCEFRISACTIMYLHTVEDYIFCSHKGQLDNLTIH